MALTFNTTPNTDSPVKDVTPFNISVDASAFNSKTILSYEVIGTGGADIILPRQTIDDCGGQVIELNLSQHLESRVSTELPPLNTAGVTTDGSFQNIFSVNFTETSFNIVNCTSTELTNISQGSYNIYNIAPQWYESNLFINTDPIPLSAKPATIYTTRGQNDWIWVRMGASGVASYQVVGGATQNVSLNANTTYIIPCGAANWIGVISDTTKVLRLVIGDNAQLTYNIVLEPDCTGADGYELYWLEPRGGYAGMRFENRSSSATRNTSQVRADRATGTTISTRGSTGGLTNVNSQSFGRVSLSKEMYYTEGIEDYLKGFIASEDHYINRNINGTAVMTKFIVDNAEYLIDDDEGIVIMTVSGREHENINVLRNS